MTFIDELDGDAPSATESRKRTDPVPAGEKG
jgi:hypothetical protein